MQSDVHNKTLKIQTHEWHLWYLALTLILLLSGLLVSTYFFIGGGSLQELGLFHKVLGGVSILVVLFWFLPNSRIKVQKDLNQ